ncbi:MAG TPA: MarR family winged helix-turn-helix transcriptional regulator [Friedmanniella sp.]
MSARLTSLELDTWQRLQQVTERLQREVGRGLRADADLSGAEFATLAGLAAAGGEDRPAACARRIGWDSSRLAHQLERLENRGLVRRSPTAGRGRASIVALTEAGRDAHRHAVGPHLRAAKRWFADALDHAQVEALADALQSLEHHTDALTETDRQHEETP